MHPRLLLFLCFLSSLAYANEQYTEIPEVSSTEGIPSSLINGSVCAISGEYTESTVDMVIAGVEPLVIGRNYSNKSNPLWSLNHIDKLEVKSFEDCKHPLLVIKLRQSNGSTVDFVHPFDEKERKLKHLVCKLRSPKGLTNGASGLSGRTNLKNQVVNYHGDKQALSMINGAGDESQFEWESSHSRICRQKKLKKINGSSYSYEIEKHQSFGFSKITCSDRNKNQIFSQVRMARSRANRHTGVLSFEGSDKKKLKYIWGESPEIFETEGSQVTSITQFYYITRVESSYAPTTAYLYTKKADKNFFQICEKRLPKGRYLRIDYYKKGINQVGGSVGNVKIKHADDFRLDRVLFQKAPVGIDEKSVITHRFVYEQKKDHHHEVYEGSTDVYDAHDQLTRYTYDKHHRLKRIKHFKGRNAYQLAGQELFKWGRGTQEGNLMAKIVLDEHEAVHHARYYTYDEQGNVLKSELCGRLTGLPAPNVILRDDLSPYNHQYEKEQKTYTYSQDYRNLVISETDSSGKMTVYDYVEKTDRIKAKWTIYQNQIRLREFYTYNDHFVLTRKIVDDGSEKSLKDLTGVTQRRFTHIIPRQTAPIGLPQEIIECYLDLKTGKKHRLASQTFEYSIEGHLLKKQDYDANHQLISVQTWQYDAHGNVIQQTDALGQVIQRKYDENNNLIFLQGPSLDFYTENTYDYANRLVRQEEFHLDGARFATTYKYNRLSQCVATTNPYGHQIKQTYDEAGRVIKVEYPAIVNEVGELVTPVITTDYNVAGHPIAVTDAKGRQTVSVYNIRGQPIHVTYPNGLIETFTYRLDGQLTSKKAKNGLVTHYRRDPTGRVTEEQLLSAEGVLLKKKTYHYNAFHLIRSTDETGQVTHYQYDAAGRIERTIQDEHVQQIFYDSCGRCCEKREWYSKNPSDYRSLLTSYDTLNRVIEQTVQSADGSVLSRKRYAYDAQNNVISEQNGDEITLKTYNPHQQITQITNAKGEQTRTQYNHCFIDAYGRQVLQTIITDPMGYQTIDTYDPANRLVEVCRKTPHGVLVSKQQTFYDICGNICRTQNHLVEAGEVKGAIESLLCYSIDDQPTAWIEASGTPEQKITRYQYNALGQKCATIKNDGTTLFQTYDCLGRLESLMSSDGTIHYHYTYNVRDQPTEILDVIHAQTTSRQYDKDGHMIGETLGHGLSLYYSYDLFGRHHFVLLPDQTGWEYVHDAQHLKEIHRIIDGQRVYTHRNQAHTLKGDASQIKLANDQEVHYSYDLLGRCTSIETPSYTQSVPKEGFDAAGNLKLYYQQQEPHHFSYDHLYQLTTEKEHTYQFDSLNNRTDKDGEKHAYNALNQLIQKGADPFIYDRNGNLIQRCQEGKISKYVYDALDRLTAILQDDQLTTYTYDPLNRRLSKKQGSQESLFLYQGLEEIGRWQEQGFQELRLLGKQHPMVAIELQGVLHVPIHDLAGNVICLQDDQGQVVERYRYTAFGETQIFSPSDELRRQSALNNPWQYASKRLDAESGLVAFGLRYYDATLGRWISPDPLGTGDGPNLYAYVHNSPLTFHDQFGLFSLLPFTFNPSVHMTQEVGEPYEGKKERAIPLNFGIEKVMAEIHDLTANMYRLEEGSDPEPYQSRCNEKSSTYEITAAGNVEPFKGTFQFNQYPNIMVGGVNGMNTNFEDFSRNFTYLRENLNHNIYAVHSATFGIAFDSIRCFLGYKGISCETVREIHRLWDAFFNRRPKGEMLWFCHSKGAIETNVALLTYSKELRERITVIAIAPAKFISPEICKDVVHLVSLDLIPLCDLIGMVRYRSTVKFVGRAKGADLIDHSMRSESYKIPLISEYKLFIKG
jgi:RHS repeat-associated protein